MTQGKILTVQERAGSRVVPVCPMVGRCGGCQLQHMAYEEQLTQKRFILEDTLRRIGKISDVTISPVIPSPRPYGYRQVLRMGIGQGPEGFFLGFLSQGLSAYYPLKPVF